MDMLERSNAAYALHVEASALRASGKNEEAAEKWRACVGLIPDEPGYLREYADCCARLGRWEEGLRASTMAVSLDPSNGEAWALMAGAHGNLGNQDDFIRCLTEADRRAPNCPSVRWNRSLWLLLHGHYAQGWADYEWRFQSNQRYRSLKAPWGGVCTADESRVLFIAAEQGYGDTIQFVRFVKRAKERWWRGRVVLEAQRELITLLQGQDLGFDEIIAPCSGGSIPYDDFEHVSLMSLPYVLGIDDETEFWGGEYLTDESAELPPSNGRMRIGLAWGGNAAHSCNSVRSIDGEEFWGALAEALSGSDLYLLQPDAKFPAEIVLDDVGRSLGENDGLSFADTARIIKSLDLVITVDTAVAHLAGAMGKPVWLLNRYATDWRWCLNHPTSTPWYPSMRIFRQKSYGEGWGPVLAEVSAALDNFIKDKRL